MRIFILILIILSTNSVNAQELSEAEIIKTRNIQEYLISNPEKAYAEALEISKCKNELFRFYGSYYIANYFYNKSDFNHSKTLLLTLIENIEKANQNKSGAVYQELLGMAVNKLFYIHKNLGEYDTALFYLEKYKNSVPRNKFNEQYGLIKVATGDYVNGISLLKQELLTTPHLKLGVGEKEAMNKKLFADKYNIIGEAYQNYYVQSPQKKFLDSANNYFDESAKMLLEAHFQPEYTQALLNMRKAKSAALAGDYEQSMSLYRTRVKFPVIKEHIRTLQLFDLGMADCFHHLKQVDSALFYGQKYIESYENTKVSKENLLMAYNIMTQCYQEKKDHRKAYSFAQKSLELIRSIEAIKSKSLNFLHNYDLEIIEAESNKVIQSKNHIKILLFAILIVLILVVYGFYHYYKKQQENHARFLNIIQNLKGAKMVMPEPSAVTVEPPLRQTMDSKLVEKLSLGLKKLEEKEYFLDPNFKLALVAKKLNTNTAYLSQYFNQSMQKTFTEYTQELRIQYVLQKLKDSPQFRKYTLQAMAEEVGYKDANTFVRVFKKQTGLSLNYYIDKTENSS
ncbi:helix-turn-helix domain-containing protein [Flavobacterium sp. NST-5]|uniref:Helix-turn-helix domain-containing protein n=1 Tax=Flavobacterium ichthyis TaxID=2698827 RepID=A0ABW9Z9D5_9FLAO|nr:helix-turn-helix domain-containing protein [Flavobacterium ichthyis]NBL63690.1 helix-turn-helix domain-containing protein [Flavobacterium ichthyis]